MSWTGQQTTGTNFASENVKAVVIQLNYVANIQIMV